MSGNGFPIGAVLLFFAAMCFAGIRDSRGERYRQALPFGLGLLGAFLAFAALLIAVAIS